MPLTAAFSTQVIARLRGGEAWKDDSQLETWFLQKFSENISQPLDIRFTDKISFGFKIGVAGEGNHINFSDGLVQVFSEFCSPRFRKHFFPRKES